MRIVCSPTWWRGTVVAALLAALLGVAAVSVAAVAPLGAAHADNNLIVNGDFETPALDPSRGLQTFETGGTIDGGFTVTRGNVDLTARTFYNTPVHGGNQALDLNGFGPGTITQAISTTPGRTYQLTFFLAANPGQPDRYRGPRTLDVTAGAGPALSYSAPATQTYFVMETQSFVADGMSANIVFASTTPDIAGPILDDISVVDAAFAASPTPYPTQTPLPTYTPQSGYPTQTPLPTYTPQPGYPTPAPGPMPPGPTPMPSRPVSPAAPTLLYIAGGRDDAATRATLAVLNAQPLPITARLTFYLADGVTRDASLTVGPRTQRLVPLAGLIGSRGLFGLRVTASRQLAAQLVETQPGHDADALLGVPALATRQYLAEGYTRLTFHETVSILNPDAARPARVALQLLPSNGRAGRTVTVRAPAHTHTAVDVDGLLAGQALSIIADSDRPVLVERTLTFGRDGHGSSYGVTMQTAAPTTATRWLFPEGTTTNRFQTFLTILNPDAGATRVTARFYSTSGAILGSRGLTVAPRSRATLQLGSILRASSVASVVTSDRPVVVEQPEYFGSPNAVGVAGSVVLGRATTNTRWSFPNGDTRAGHSEFLLLYNPSTLQPVRVDVAMYSGGVRMTRRILVGPTARYTLDVRRVFPGIAGLHGATLQSADGQGFVVEQTAFATDHSTLIGTESYYNSGA